MSYSRPWMFLGLTLMAAGTTLLCQQGCRPANDPKPEEPVTQASPEPVETSTKESPPKKQKNTAPQPTGEETLPWKSLFDGKALTGWKTLQFGGEGEVQVRDGMIVMEMGSMMTGIAWTGEIPRDNYELALEGMRLDGADFFCTTTFPVGDEPCTLVVGGWGGGVVGLSNVDFQDASNNATMKFLDFKENQWYRVRIRVTDAAIEAWIDDEQVVNQPREGHKFGIRDEVELCRPLGIASYCTKGAVRNIRVRSLKP